MLPKTQSLRSWIDFCLGILGLIAAVVGWHFDHVEHFEWLQRLIAPRYFAAMQLYDHMFVTHQAAHRGDPGFEEIVSLVQGDLHGQGELTIDSLQITDNALSFMSRPNGMSSEPTISLTVTVADGRTTSASSVPDLRAPIKEKFLQSRLFGWGASIFWSGIGLSTLVLVHSLLRAREKPPTI